MKHKLLIAVSMRVTHESAYSETRDAVSWDWPLFFEKSFPNVIPVLIPNNVEVCAQMLERLQPDGILLTGGNDIGSCPERDSTERYLLEFGIAQKIPVLGICRGMQFIGTYFGSKLVSCDPQIHRSQRHVLTWDREDELFSGYRNASVNSFHTQCFKKLSRDLICIAHTSDDTIEVLKHCEFPIFGIMWHPERESPHNLNDIYLFEQLYNIKRY